LKQNKTGLQIDANKNVFLSADGSIVLADRDVSNRQVTIGVTLEAIADDAIGRVALIGPNIVGVLAGLGAAPGQRVFLSNVPGAFSLDPNINPASNSIVRIGYADVAAGAAGGDSNDLILAYAVESRITP
jgi:hypothetical protein